MDQYKNKIALVTGGSSGIGFATAKYFLKNNWNVIISSSNSEKLTNAKNKIQDLINFIKKIYLQY